MVGRTSNPSRPAIAVLSKLPPMPDLHDRVHRRASERWPVNVRVSIDGRTEEAWAINLSAGGVRVVAEAQLEVGEEVFLRMGDPPGSGGLHGRGRVVWVRRQGEDVVAGIEFLQEAA